MSGPANVIDGNTIVVAGQLVRLHGIDAPELDQTFMWRGQQMVCGTMSLAALEALTAGVKVRLAGPELADAAEVLISDLMGTGRGTGRLGSRSKWAVPHSIGSGGESSGDVSR